MMLGNYEFLRIAILLQQSVWVEMVINKFEARVVMYFVEATISWLTSGFLCTLDKILNLAG